MAGMQIILHLVGGRKEDSSQISKKVKDEGIEDG